MEITSATIVRKFGPDKVFLHTTLPNACYPFTGTQMVSMDVAAGDGAQYMQKHFPNVPLEVVGTKQ